MPPEGPTATIRTNTKNRKANPMKSSRLILSAVVLATVALPPALRAETPTPAAPTPAAAPAAEPDPGLREIECKVVQKQYESALQELLEAEKAVKTATTPEQKQVQERAYVQRKQWVDQLKAQLTALEPGANPKVAALTNKLDAIVIPKVDIEDGTIREVVEFLRLRGKELDPDKSGVNLVLMDKENQSTVTLRLLENVTLHTVLKLVAGQAGLAIDIGEDVVTLRNKKTETAPVAQPAAREEEDVAFFEKKYQKKITGVKPKGEYPDPDQFYSAIGKQLGIPEIAWNAAAAKFGWKKDDGKQTFTMLKGGPVAGAAQGSWDVLFIRSAINPETKKPDPATMEQVMVQLDYDGNATFPEIPKGNR
jgi:hypothetical protein